MSLAASTPNIYLMPEFVLPAIRHLDLPRDPKFAVVWNTNETKMLALCFVGAPSPNLRFPYSHLRAVKTKHSYQTGILVRNGSEREALDNLLYNLLRKPWQALAFAELREDSLLHQQLQDAALRRGLKWYVEHRYLRASVEIGEGVHWTKYVSRSRLASLRKARARLEKLGCVQSRILFDNEVTDSTLKSFLRVESLGWKANSSLRATGEEHAFFIELIEACRSSGTLFFCELLLDGKVIASTSNFHVNGLGFAFKVGMDPKYAKYSPGYLVEIGFLEAIDSGAVPFREIESGAQPGSYIEKLWPGRAIMVSGYFVSGGLPSAYSALPRVYSMLKRWAKRFRAYWMRG
ncbi:MAG: GNAT family N-acetyltransferase [Woeseia sp.]|nr:GNAT family N-acetyltransferase [Woeseia sp.]